MFVLEFSPPMEGFEGDFNTFRPSLAWPKRVSVGDIVLLIDRKSATAFGRAKVTELHTGKLMELAWAHAFMNHNQRALGMEGAPERLFAAMQKRYGPRVVTEDRKSAVIYLKRL